MKSEIAGASEKNSFNDEELLEGWHFERLGHIATRITKGATPTSYGYEFQKTGIKFVKIENIINGQISEASIKQFISSEANENQKRAKLESGDILFSIAGTIGNVCLIKEEDLPANTNQAVAIIRGTSQCFDPKFLQFFLKSKMALDQVTTKARGGAMNNVSLDDIRDIIVPLPPRSEQQRIIARVESLLSHVNNAHDRLSRVPLIMKKFRQAVLAAAFSGRLTEGWREENTEIECIDIPALSLHQKYQKSEFNSQDVSILPEKWQWSKLFETVEIFMGQSPPGVSYNQNEDGIPLINGPVEFGPTPFSETIRSKFTTHPTKLCKKNDLLLCVRGSTTGRINIAGFEACIGRGVAALRSKTNQKYLTLFIHSKEDYIYSLGIGSTFPNISSDVIANLDFPLPPLAEQFEIVRRVNALFERADAIERDVMAASRRCDRLSQSVLGKAFRGELVPPEMAEV
jgi:type I restriction enzyme S subunit